MKKDNFLVFGMLAMTLALGFVIPGCGTTNSSTRENAATDNGGPATTNTVVISDVEAVVTDAGGPPKITITWKAVGNVPKDQYKFYYKNEDKGRIDNFPVLSITEDQGKLSAYTTAGDYNFDWRRGSNVSWGVSAGEDQDGSPIIVWSAVGTIPILGE